MKTPFLRVLVADDDEDFAATLSDFLALSGCRVLTCNTVAQCIEAMSRTTFDLAFVDGTLRGRDGYRVVESLRLSERDMTIAVLSGNDEEERRRQAFSAGANYYLMKPFSLSEVRAILCEVGENICRLQRTNPWAMEAVT
jgi:DNA-binding response OmpR family regulator